MAWRIKLREERPNARLRDGKGFVGRMKLLSVKEWVRFENLPNTDDPNLMIEEIKKVPTINRASEVPAPKKKPRRRKKTTSAKAPKAETPAENID